MLPNQNSQLTPMRTNTWLLSLADLVTLLLAVTVLGLTAGTLDQLSAELASGSKEGSSGLGIILAKDEGSPAGRTLYLYPEQFGGLQQELNADGVKALESLVRYASDTGDELEVMTCQAEGEEAGYASELLRLLTLHRQLFGESVGREEPQLARRVVRMTLLGEQCELLGAHKGKEPAPIVAVRRVGS